MIAAKRRSKALLTGVAAILAISWLTPAPAKAALCLSHGEIVSKLGSKFKEKRRAFGLINSGRMLEVYVSKTGSWTMVITSANKIACVVAAGDSWEQWKVKFGPVT